MNITLSFIDLSVQTTSFLPHFLRQNIFERNKLFFYIYFSTNSIISISSTGLGDVSLKLRFDYSPSSANKTGENQVHVQSCCTFQTISYKNVS